MSKNRRRGGRRTNRQKHTAGAHGNTARRDVETDLVCTRRSAPLPQPGQSEFLQGQGKRQPKQPSNGAAWNQHDIDMSPTRYGKLRRHRDVSAGWGGKFIAMQRWAPGDFINGRDLVRDGKFTLYVQDKHVGRTDDWTVAKAFRLAAKHLGLKAEMYNSGGEYL